MTPKYRSLNGRQIICFSMSLGFAILLGGLTACGGDGDAENSSMQSPQSSAAMNKAAIVFEQRCVMCHGSSGRGDGPAATMLSPSPADFTTATWQKTHDNEIIATAIIRGGAAVGKSAAMPAHPDLANQDALIEGLILYIRSLAQ